MLLDVIQDGADLQVSYWDINGKTNIEVVNVPHSEQFIWLTKPKDKGDIKSKDKTNWNGDPVYKHRLDISKEKLNRYRMYEILDSQPDSLKEKIFAHNMPQMFFIDIENEMQYPKADPDKADKPITVIGICCPNDTVMVLSAGHNLLQKEVENIQKMIDEHFKQVNRKFKFVFRYFPTEYDLLYFFMHSLVPKMALMTGWNFEGYDWKYIVNRCKQLSIDPSMASPTHTLIERDIRPAHVGLIDYLDAYKKWTWNSNENYKLDTIGEKLCKIKKVQHAETLDDMLHNNFEKYVYYNAIDCCLVKLIHEACNAVTCGLTTSWLGRIQAMHCFSTTYIPENLLRISFSEQNKVLAVDPFPKKKDTEKYEGAFVKQPIPGLHKYCTCNDYASLYPSIMRQFNIGPETLVKVLPENDEVLKQEWRDKGYIVCASGAVYQKPDGNLKKIITDLYFKRKAYKKTSFKFTQIGYDLKDLLKANASPEEIEDYLSKNGFEGRKASEVKEIIEYCAVQAAIYNNFQLGTKVVINGIYGAFGYAGFYFYNPVIAESVTKQGKDAILNSERRINLWANRIWQKDVKTHKAMGIKITKPDKDIKPVTRYIDTDSIYTSFENILDVCDWFDHDVWRLTKINRQNDQKDFVYVSKGGYPTEDDARVYFDVASIDESKFEWNIDTIEPGGREFCLTLNRVFMSDFLKKIHEEYAAKNGTPNILDFELEAYNEAGIWLAKKKYIKNMTWSEPNVYYDSCEHIKATGVEIAQTSSSPWVKKQLTDLVTWIFRQENFVMDSFVKQVEKVKKQFMLQSPETISVNKAMNKYDEYVLNDTDEIEMNAKAMITVQGAALYNHILNNSEKLKKRYNTLFDSDKLCVIYVKPNQRYKYWKKESQVPVKDVNRFPDQYKLISQNTDVIQVKRGKDVDLVKVYTDVMSLQQCEAFSYPAGMYPMDMTMNLEIDKNRMFELLILNPVNRIVNAMGYPEIDMSMTYETGLW